MLLSPWKSSKEGNGSSHGRSAIPAGEQNGLVAAPHDMGVCREGNRSPRHGVLCSHTHVRNSKLERLVLDSFYVTLGASHEVRI